MFLCPSCLPLVQVFSALVNLAVILLLVIIVEPYKTDIQVVQSQIKEMQLQLQTINYIQVWWRHKTALNATLQQHAIITIIMYVCILHLTSHLQFFRCVWSFFFYFQQSTAYLMQRSSFTTRNTKMNATPDTYTKTRRQQYHMSSHHIMYVAHKHILAYMHILHITYVMLEKQKHMKDVSEMYEEIRQHLTQLCQTSCVRLTTNNNDNNNNTNNNNSNYIAYAWCHTNIYNHCIRSIFSKQYDMICMMILMVSKNKLL